MKQHITSAGVMYFYIRGVLDEGNEISIYVQDTYNCLPEAFYKNVSSAVMDESASSETVHLFGVIGVKSKTNAIAGIVKNELQLNYQRIIDGSDILKSSALLDQAGNAYFKLVQEFYCEQSEHLPHTLNRDSNEWRMNCIWSSNASEEIAHSLADYIIETWIEHETPAIMGKQLISRSFFMSDFVNRKAIACFEQPSDKEWHLLFEGGSSLNLDTVTLYKGISSPNELGYFSAAGINSILLMPAYSYGIHLYPDDISLEWHKAFLYACAISDVEWNADVFDRIYCDFLDFLKDNICHYSHVEPIISRENGCKAFIQNIKTIRIFLTGMDEPVISKDLFQFLNTRYVYLPYVFDFVNQHNVKAKSFDEKTLLGQISSALHANDTYRKGVLWEDVAKYVLENIDGWRITGRRVRAGTQEIDLSVANVSLDNDLWQLGAYILVECKNWNYRVNIPQIRNIAYISSIKGNKTALLFASNGITKAARMEIERLAENGLYIIVIDKNDLEKLHFKDDCKRMILDKYSSLQ